MPPDKRGLQDMRRVMQLSNLVELLKNSAITITNVQCEAKACVDITETNSIKPEKFKESVEFLNEATLFRDAIDFYYEFTGDNSLRIQCGMKNIYMEEYYYVDCVISNYISAKDIDSKLRETIFDKIDKEIAV